MYNTKITVKTDGIVCISRKIHNNALKVVISYVLGCFDYGSAQLQIIRN